MTNQNAEFIDYSKFREEALDHFTDLEQWEDNDPFHVNLMRIIDACVKLPEPEVQLPLVTTYCLIPSVLCRVLPILLCIGQSGSGKSTIGFLASKIHKVSILSSGDTFASIRNNLASIKGYDHEKNCFMVWDDIDEDVFIQKPDIYRMLKFGYDRSSDIISIAKRGGDNQSFRVFSPKIISTISPLYNSVKFPELTRRCMVIHTKKLQNNLDNDYELLDPKLINWNDIENYFLDYWNNVETCKEFTLIRKGIARRKPKSLSSERWLISLDVITTGIVLGVWEDSKTAIQWLKDYWTFHDFLTSNNESSLEQLIKDFIQEETTKLEKLNQLLPDENIPIIIDAEKFKRMIDYWKSKGLIDTDSNLKTIKEIMNNLGYTLTKQGWLKQ